MKLLILGGTLFLGRHLVEAAQASGHTVTLFNRGRTNPNLHSDVESLQGDRDGNLSALRGRQWDAVIDTSGYVPRLVEATAALLADSVDQYVFISSGSVYADFSKGDIVEDAPVKVLADETREDVSTAYGELKALCEREAELQMPGRVLSVRSGLLVGPHDPSNRFGYWLQRVSRGGTILAPGRPDRPIQLIHTRDMADWIVRMVEIHQSGIYNATGPATVLTMQAFLETCRTVIGGDAEFEWVDEPFLIEQGVAPFSELPLWLPEESNGMLQMNIDRALAAGLSFRSLPKTVEETLVWMTQAGLAQQPSALASGVSGSAGMTIERESELLAKWVEKS